MCQINTSVMKKQLGCLDVLVPPDIVDDATSSDVTVREGDDATLVCRATGKPAPRVVWRREDGEPMLIRSGPREVAKLDTVNGDELRLSRLDRRQMAAYLCIASNDVPPAVSKRITLNVNFSPVVKVPNQLVGAPLGTDVQLECFVEAFPNTINYWVKNRGEMLLDGVKHHVEEERFSYKVHLRLTIRNITAKDLGTYTCVSTNSLGHNDGTVRLYEIKIPTRPPTTTTIMPETTVPALKTTTLRPDRTNALILTTSPPLQAMVAASPVEPLPQPPGPSRDLPGAASASGAAGAAGAGASVSSGARRGAVSRGARATPAHWLLPLLLLHMISTTKSPRMEEIAAAAKSAAERSILKSSPLKNVIVL
ncbi:lachesin-like [Schistocerca cancellata]|uniref:lachesin-like n=1 Tax=Schistocerca cancellata TaxID=274614 RepID=UPI002117E9E1|nr:lachesin-like [Schistocerca cancellata]